MANPSPIRPQSQQQVISKLPTGPNSWLSVSELVGIEAGIDFAISFVLASPMFGEQLLGYQEDC